MREGNSGGMAYTWDVPRRRFTSYNSPLHYFALSIVPAMSHESTDDANNKKRRLKRILG
ncbi:hypothetical protein DFP72DRAFT_1068948 [Ephemerocybe angulata]|uniref:Uncharacterized protein n=1 Tax=Ephemerocybe angulata TaxID=980116 RepID=A0A8H6M5U1_9AGAR|nr:hypothetical protein DFP72DRAFT_1068948 [Tulosesus angulatus]